MAETKAEQALKDAESKSNIKIKVYYNGNKLDDCGSVDLERNLEPLDAEHMPWLFKVYIDNGVTGRCSQYADTGMLYRQISRKLGLVLDTAIVNSKQRDSIDLLVDELLYNALCIDQANGHDVISNTDRII